LKRIILIILVLALLLPSFVFGEGLAKEQWVIDQKLFGVGGLNLDKNMNRAELATVTIRLMGLEKDAKKYKGKSGFKDADDYQDGWARGYIALAKNNNLISGKSKDRFDPSGNLLYVDLLTVFMRVLGYEDGMDFVHYPKDYYDKALEIGLADMYIPGDTVVLRDLVLSTMVKALNTYLRDEDYTLFELLDGLPKEEDPIGDITADSITFNTLVTGVFSGQLKGAKDFTGYKIVLLSGAGNVYDDQILRRNGVFSFSGFDIGILAKLNAYKYEVYNTKGKLVLEDKCK